MQALPGTPTVLFPSATAAGLIARRSVLWEAGCHATAKPPNCEYTDGSRKESAQCVCGGETCPPPPAGQRGTVPKYYCIDGGCTDTDYCPQHQRYRCRWGNVHVRRREMLRGAVLPQRRVPWLRRVRGHEQTLSDHLVVQVRRLGLRWFPTLLRRQTLPRSAHVPRLRNREFPVSSKRKSACANTGAAPASWVSTARNGGAPPFPRARTDKAPSANSQDCQCNSNMCTNGQYCRQDLSHCSDDVILEPCSNTIATAKSAAICKCGDSVCAKDQYCLAAQGMCSDAVPELWERYYVQPTDVPGNQESGKAYQCVNTAHTIQSVDACADAKTAGVTDVPVSSSPIYPVLEESGRRIPVYAYGCMAVSDSQSPNHVTGKFNDWYYRDPESSAPAAVTVVNTADHRCDTLLNEAACNTALSLYWQYSEYESMYTVPVGEKNDYPAGCSFHDTSGSQYLNRYRANFNSHVPSNDLAAHSPVCNVNYYSGIGYFECLCGGDTQLLRRHLHLRRRRTSGLPTSTSGVAGTNTVCGGEALPRNKVRRNF